MKAYTGYEDMKGGAAACLVLAKGWSYDEVLGCGAPGRSEGSTGCSITQRPQSPSFVSPATPEDTHEKMYTLRGARQGGPPEGL